MYTAKIDGFHYVRFSGIEMHIPVHLTKYAAEQDAKKVAKPNEKITTHYVRL